MKILHFADLHLGVETYGRLDPESGLSTRLLDFLAARRPGGEETWHIRNDARIWRE